MLDTRLPKQFIFFIILRFFTTLATQIKVTVLSYYLYQITHSPMTLAYIGIIEAIPKIAMSLPAGYLVERMEKRKAIFIVILSYTIGTLAIGLSMQHLSHSPYFMWIIYIAILMMGLIGSLGPSSTVSIFSHIAPKSDTARLAAINSNSWQIGAIIGPIIGGSLMYKIGAVYTIYIAVAMLIVSLVATMLIHKIPSTDDTPFSFQNSYLQIKEGLNFVFSNKILLWAISLDLFAVLFGGSVALLPIFARDILMVGESGYGWLKAAMPLGSAISMIGLTVRPLNHNTGKWLLGCVGLFGVFTIIFALSTSWWLSLTMLFLMGATDAVSVVIRSTLLILETPEHMKARVTSVNQIFISSSNEIGAFESGIAAKLMGTVKSVVFGGTMTIFFVILAFRKAKKLVSFEFNNQNEPKP